MNSPSFLPRDDWEREPAAADDARHLVDLDTRDANAGDRGHCWNQALARASAPVHVFATARDGLAGRLRADLVGSLRLLTINADAQTVVRAPIPAKGGERPAFYKFILHLAGRCRFAQDGRVVDIGERAFTVCDTSRPYTLEFFGPYTQQVLMIPRAALSVPSESVATLTATLIPIQRGAFRVLARIMRDLREDIGELSQRNRLTIAETLTELSEAVLRERLGSELSPAESGVFAEILAFVEHHLGDPNLTPQVIASAHFMSVRSLQTLFQSREQSPSGWIRKRRLENCRRDLIRFQGEQSISAIAARWGFPDSGNFTRAFKKAFGLTPQEYRRRHAADHSGQGEPPS